MVNHENVIIRMMYCGSTLTAPQAGIATLFCVYNHLQKNHATEGLWSKNRITQNNWMKWTVTQADKQSKKQQDSNRNRLKKDKTDQRQWFSMLFIADRRVLKPRLSPAPRMITN